MNALKQGENACAEAQRSKKPSETHTKKTIVLWFGFFKKHERKNDSIKGGVRNKMSVVLGCGFIFLFFNQKQSTAPITNTWALDGTRTPIKIVPSMGFCFLKAITKWAKIIGLYFIF